MPPYSIFSDGESEDSQADLENYGNRIKGLSLSCQKIVYSYDRRAGAGERAGGKSGESASCRMYSKREPRRVVEGTSGPLPSGRERRVRSTR